MAEGNGLNPFQWGFDSLGGYQLWKLKNVLNATHGMQKTQDGESVLSVKVRGKSNALVDKLAKSLVLETRVCRFDSYLGYHLQRARLLVTPPVS